MSGKRVLALYGALLFCFAAVVCRLYWLCSDTAYGARAAAQSVVTLRLSARRGNFYDCDGHLLTGLGTKWEALCVPGEGNYTRLFSCTDVAGQALLYQKRNALAPFFLEVEQDVSALGIFCWPVSVRSPAARYVAAAPEGQGTDHPAQHCKNNGRCQGRHCRRGGVTNGKRDGH